MAITAKVNEGDLAKVGEAVGKIVDAGRAKMLAAAQATAETIEARGRADIAKAGNFGSRWTEGFKVAVTGEGDAVSLTVSMEAEHWEVFQYGATITGRPWLYFKPTKMSEAFTMKSGGKLPSVIRKRSVTIPKKFHLVEIVEEEVAKAGGTLKATIDG